jgi:hypothetical protein
MKRLTMRQYNEMRSSIPKDFANLPLITNWRPNRYADTPQGVKSRAASRPGRLIMHPDFLDRLLNGVLLIDH